MALTKVTGQVIKNTTDVTVGVLTVTNTLAVGGTVSVGGTLTYEDVTNVDAVGLITARNGIVVGSGITLSKDGDGFFTGVTTATTFVGALTGNVTGNISGGTVAGSTGTFTGNVAVSGANITLQDSGSASDDRIALGAGGDLQLFHDGSNSYVRETGTGSLFLEGNSTIYIGKASGGAENGIVYNVDGSADLYHNNSKKFETTNTGATVTGVLISDGLDVGDNEYLRLGTGNDFVIGHAETSSFLRNDTGELYIRSDGIRIVNQGNDETYIKCVDDGAVELYHNNSKKIETSSSGITISGDNSTGSYIKGVTRFTPNDSTTVKVMWDEGGFSGAGHFQVKDGVAFTAGDSSDLKIYHDGSSTSHVAEGTGNLRISVAGGSNQIQLTKGTAPTENIAKFIADGAVELYHNNIKMFETTSYGTSTQGTHIVFGAEGGDAILQLRADEGDDSADKFRIISQASDNTLRIMDIPDGGTWEDKIVCNNNAGVELYYNNSKKAESNDAGFRVSGALQSSSGNGNYYLRTQHTTIQEGGNSVTITLTGLTFSFGVFRIGGYASAGQASVSLHILFGGYMTHTANYNATVLANHAQGSSISLTKNNSSYVITITNNANNYDLFCNMMIESANSAFAMALS